MTLFIHDGYMIYGDLSYYKLIPVSVFNTTSKILNSYV